MKLFKVWGENLQFLTLKLRKKKERKKRTMTRNARSWWWDKEKKMMALVFITITMMLQFQIKACVETERMGLLQLKSYFENLIINAGEEDEGTPIYPEEESILKSWSHRKSDCCRWDGVKCSDAIGGGHIVVLSLNEIMPYTDLDRPLNLSLLHSFPQLQTLEFSRNGFSYLFDLIHGTFFTSSFQGSYHYIFFFQFSNLRVFYGFRS